MTTHLFLIHTCALLNLLAVRAKEQDAVQPPVAATSGDKQGQQYVLPVKVMTFNTWNNGNNVLDGIRKLAMHVHDVQPDVVAFQELQLGSFEPLLLYLGPEWSGFHRIGAYPDTGIATKHYLNRSTIVETDYAVGCQITIQHERGPQQLNVWSVHTDYRNYGPYAACNKMATRAFQIEAGEYNIGEAAPGRVQNILELGANVFFNKNLQQADKIPLFVMGDFNAPSHLDWIEPAKELHCDRSFAWPTSKLIEEYGLVDSFREVYPNPVTHPGNTWSTVQKYSDGWGWTIPEPQDRIDFIYYRSRRLKPVEVAAYEGVGPIIPKPYYQNNTWPSDHHAVVGQFKLFI